MEDVKPVARRHSSQSSQSTSHSRTNHRTAQAPAKRVGSPHSDENSFTSFPSLDPSLEDTLETVAPPGSGSPRSPVATAIPKVASKSDFEDLFKPPPSANDDRSSLFDDVPKDLRFVPGTVHFQSDAQVKHLISRVGGVALVKQLAEDLAQRDAQVTQLQRKAEERERLLRKMLQECQVSNLDIETRLRAFERDYAKEQRRSRGAVAGQNDSIDDRISEALSEELDFNEVVVGSYDTQDERLGYTTIRRVRTASGKTDLNSSRDSSVAGSRKPSEAGKGWKDYFRYGKSTSRKVSDEAADKVSVKSATTRMSNQRRGLTSDVFIPPPEDNSSPPASIHGDSVGSKARRPSASGNSVHSNSSATSWAMKLVGGNGPSKQPASQSKARASTVSSGTAGKKPDPPPFPRTKSGLDASRRLSAIITGPNGAVKKPNAASMIPTSPRRNSDSSSNLGPVEMDTILPDGVRPPTFTQNDNLEDSTGLLTDRFGFIYDQRRRKLQRQADAAMNHVEANAEQSSGGQTERVEFINQGDNSRSSTAPSEHAPGDQPPTAKQGWTDYLKLSNFPTELLSHTPSAMPIAGVTTENPLLDTTDKAPQLVLTAQGTAPALSVNPAPSPTHALVQNAEIAKPMPMTATSRVATSQLNQDPVKSLLDQLTEVHDSLQKDRTVKWNEFLRKVRAERKRDGDALASQEGRNRGPSMPEASLMDGEIIGVAGLGNKGKVGKAKWNEFRTLVLGGIPVAYRAKIWAECSGAVDARIPGYYDDLVTKGGVDEIVVQQIQMDITRTLTDNIFFRKGQGVQKLREVLLAYALRNPEIGYCQGMNLITANLLLILPTAEDAFWVLTSMVENILPEKYYDSSLLTSRADQVVLRSFVAELLPQLSKHLDGMNIELEALTFQWFLSVFTDCLSAEALFRVWDVVLCMHNGSTFLFQVALALLKLNEKSLLACDGPAEVYGYINQRMTDHAISIDGLIRASDALKKVVQRDEVTSRRKDAVERELETLRQREAIRKGKGRVVSPPAPTGDDSPKQPVMPEISKRPGGQLSRNSSVEDDEEIIQHYGEVEVRTPMPIDEEAMWRA